MTDSADRTSSVNPHATISARRPHERWPSRSVFPTQTPDLRVVFHGLLSFCYTDSGDAEIGVFDASPHHRLKVRISGGECNNREYNGLQLSKGQFVLEVSGDQPQGVATYQVGANLDRLDNENTSPHDFRWMLDVEGPDFYDTIVATKRPNHYQPKLLVKSGLFYTLEKTESTFKAVNDLGTVERQVGNIAFCTGCNIYLRDAQQAVLTLKSTIGENITCRFNKTGTLQQIFFTNVCFPAAGPPCLDPDFERHFDSFDPPPGHRRFRLQAVTRVIRQHSCGAPGEALKDDEKSTDEAPCGAGGYGGSPGMPPP